MTTATLSPEALPATAQTPAASHPRLSRLFRLQHETAQGNWVLLYPEGMVKLNDSAAEILRRCDGSRPVEAIVAELERLFQASGIAPQVAALIDEGRRRGWIV